MHPRGVLGRSQLCFRFIIKHIKGKPSRSSFWQAGVTILSSMIKDLFALPLPLRVRKRPSLPDSPETTKGAALGRRAGSFNQENRKHVTFLKINDTILSYVLAIITWSGELLHKEKLKDRRWENRKINPISLFESVVQRHLFRAKTPTREQESSGQERDALPGSGGQGGGGESRAPRRLGPARPGLAREPSSPWQLAGAIASPSHTSRTAASRRLLEPPKRRLRTSRRQHPPTHGKR